MIPEKAFAGLLQLDECWEVTNAEFETDPEKFVLVVRETAKLWPRLRCPITTCAAERITCHDHADARTWRHLDAFGRPTEILCAPPRAKCARCGGVWTVKVPWEGKGKHFTKDFEAFALTLMREMPVKRAGEILGENDTRLWRMLFRHVAAAHAALDLSELIHLGVDEMNLRKGHEYLTVFADLAARRVIFATEGKDHTTFRTFCDELLRHNGHPHALTHVAIDMSAAYRKGVRDNLRHATITHDPFHVVALVGQAVDEVRRLEAREGSDDTKDSLKGAMYLFRKNPENLTEDQAEWLNDLDLKSLATGQAYQVRLELSDIYKRAGSPEIARKRLNKWIGWAKAKCGRWNKWLAPLKRAVGTIEEHLEGIVAHWEEELSTAFLEGLNSVFSAVKRKARGFKSSAYMIPMLYFVAGKLSLPSYPSHRK